MYIYIYQHAHDKKVKPPNPPPGTHDVVEIWPTCNKTPRAFINVPPYTYQYCTGTCVGEQKDLGPRYPTILYPATIHTHTTTHWYRMSSINHPAIPGDVPLSEAIDKSESEAPTFAK